jgi:hypothetical protein
MSNGNSTAAEKLALAKILLRNFGTLHGFHIAQLERYPIACMNISVDGVVEVFPEKKSVKFNIMTRRHYYKNGAVTVKRDRYSPVGWLLVSNKKYEKEKALALSNLKSWTSELLWGTQTGVEVEFDVE